MIHVLPEVAVVEASFLVSMHGIVGAIEIEEDMGGSTRPAALPQIQVNQGHGELIARAPVDMVLQAAHGGLTSQVRITSRQSATHQFEERIGTQTVRIVLILVAARDLEHTLPNQDLHGVTDMLSPPVGNDGSQGRAETKRIISFPQPQETAIAGQVAKIEAGIDWQREGGTKRD
jgi:hypothetical protein